MNNKKKFLPNSWENLGKEYFVSQNNPAASDDNPGTVDKPFKTVAKAASIAMPSDIITVGEGTYREEVVFNKNGHPYFPESMMLLRAAAGDEVYIKGSDIYNPEWENLHDNIWEASLPEELFNHGAYNPYALPLGSGESVQLSRGQIYIDDAASEQVGSIEDLKNYESAFLVSESGKSIIVKFPENKKPENCAVELTVRKRCIRTSFEGIHYMEVAGIRIEHAAEPGPFCLSRPVSLRENPVSGIRVWKRFNAPGTTTGACRLVGGITYKNNSKDTMVASIIDDTVPLGPADVLMVPGREAESFDSGRTWRFTGGGEDNFDPDRSPYEYFLESEHNVLTRHYWKTINHNMPGPHPHFHKGHHTINLEYSYDGGETWSDPEIIDDNGIYFDIVKLDDGSYLWMSNENIPGYDMFFYVKVKFGSWNEETSRIDWESGPELRVPPESSSGGLAEPHCCQLADGRILLFLRQGAKLPSQGFPGYPSIKLYCASEDGGKTWTKPEPLTYDDGKYIYSPRSYQDCFTSSKNGKSYVILNICEYPTQGCDPRTALYLGEIDPESLTVKRDSVAVIDEKYPEHHKLIRFSNFAVVEDANSDNLLLFMKMHMAQACQVRRGYDNNSYLYEIELPE